MQIREMLILAPMLLLLTAAAVIDLRSRRIPNALNVLLLLTGVANSCLWTRLTPGEALLGSAAGFGLTFILFAINAMGGGDVKLFAGLGAWVGAGEITLIFAGSAIVGMALVIGQALRDRRMLGLFRNSAVIALNAASGDLSAPPEESRTDRKRLPYAVPTLVAVLLIQALHAWR